MTEDDKEDTDSLASDDVFDDKNPQLQSDNDSEDDHNTPPPNKQKLFDIFKFVGVLIYQATLCLYMAYY